MFISMLENYYDINKKNKFEELFGDLYIGKNPTKNKNRFLVWKISFAGVDAGHGEEELRKSFNLKMIYAVKNFLEDYTNFLKDEQMPENIVNAETAVAYISYLYRKASIPVFVLIDEWCR